MSDSKGKKPPKSPPAAEKGEASKGSGRVTFDSRGNPVWEWETSTGVYGRDVSTQRLKKLEAKDLAIVDTLLPESRDAKSKGVKDLRIVEPRQTPATGFNPYDSASTGAATRNRKPPEAGAGKKPVKDLRKLDQWIKLKKKMKDKGSDK